MIRRRIDFLAVSRCGEFLLPEVRFHLFTQLQICECDAAQLQLRYLLLSFLASRVSCFRFENSTQQKQYNARRTSA